MPISLDRIPEPAHGLLMAGARLLLSGIFIHEGLNLAIHIEGAVSAMGRLGVPWPLAVATIALQLGAGLSIALGWQTRPAALALGLFSMATATLFHTAFGRHDELLHFEKDLAIAGGMIALMVCGPGRYALDSIQRTRFNPALPAAMKAR